MPLMSEFPRLETPIPFVETERLLLRGHRQDDFAPSITMWTDPLVVRHLRSGAMSEEDVWTKFLRMAGHWAWMGFGNWAIEEKSTGRFVGEVGFVDRRRSVDPALDGLPEIGWALASTAQGKGYAAEAIREAHVWGAGHFGPVRTWCIINPENVPSIRLAQRCGYEEFARVNYKGLPRVVFRR
jgi:RimJ/RimL family protein N-acetyltransferase